MPLHPRQIVVSLLLFQSEILVYFPEQKLNLATCLVRTKSLSLKDSTKSSSSSSINLSIKEFHFTKEQLNLKHTLIQQIYHKPIAPYNPCKIKHRGIGKCRSHNLYDPVTTSPKKEAIWAVTTKQFSFSGIARKRCYILELSFTAKSLGLLYCTVDFMIKSNIRPVASFQKSHPNVDTL